MKAPRKPSGRRALPFYWWRRFATHKQLPYKANLLDKIRNSDFEYSPFSEQAEWELCWMEDERAEFVGEYQGKDPLEDRLYMDIEARARKRYNKLYADGMKDEFDRMDKLVIGLGKSFKMNKDDIKDIIDEFDGTTEDLYFHVAKLRGYNIKSLEMLNNYNRR